MNVNKYLLEFVGSVIFIYVILATGNGLAIGAALALLILIAGNLGGDGNFNPAVSVAMVAAKKLNVNDLLPYIILQILGGLVALEIFKRVK